jgi:NAD(P)-dependent dehydrogenase (short-subunit alcohol dehydrogenase family)
MSVLPLSLAGRTALITGAGRGFGERIAHELATLGAAVGVLDLDGDSAVRVADALRNSYALRCDISALDEVRTAFDLAETELGPIDVLVNNAGIASFTPFLESTEDELDRVFAVNLTGLFNCCRVAAPGMVERGFGRIVNISSLAGLRGGGFLGRTSYAASKAGVLGFTKALARELAPSGVTVNAVAPGAMDTEMTAVLRDDPALLERLLAQVPLGRRGSIEDDGFAVAFLCSDLASYLTGETLLVDGGAGMR